MKSGLENLWKMGYHRIRLFWAIFSFHNTILLKLKLWSQKNILPQLARLAQSIL